MPSLLHTLFGKPKEAKLRQQDCSYDSFTSTYSIMLPGALIASQIHEKEIQAALTDVISLVEEMRLWPSHEDGAYYIRLRCVGCLFKYISDALT